MAEVKEFNEVMEAIDDAAEATDVAVVEEKKSLLKTIGDGVKKAADRVMHPRTKLGKALQIGALVGGGIAIGKGIEKIKSSSNVASSAVDTDDCDDDYEYDYLEETEETSEPEVVETTEE